MSNSAVSPVRLARRRLSTVVVDGQQALGLQLAEQLVQLGLGTVILRDDNRVDEQDTGFRTVDCGRTRAEAATELIRPRAQQTALVEAPEGAAVSGADLHIVTGQGSLPVQALHRAAAESPAVLPVVAARAGWQVGPLLLRESPVCVDCLEGCELLRSDSDPDGAAAHPAMLSAAAVAAQQARVLVDGERRCVMEQVALIADSATGMIAPAAVHPRPDCACLTRVGTSSVSAAVEPVGL